MTDNEKRAHDIALVLLAEIMKPQCLVNEVVGGSKSATVDAYVKYKTAYDSALTALNRDYPSGS